MEGRKEKRRRGKNQTGESPISELTNSNSSRTEIKRTLKLDDWQEEALNHKGNLLLCTGRRVGKTQIMAIKAAERMATEKGTEIVVVSLTEDQAKLIIVFILDYLERHYKSLISKTAKDKPTLNRIVLRNKSKVIARPVGNTGDAVRGFNASILIIDEASRMPKLVWEAAKPTLLTTGGEIWMCSTPFGKQGYFWEKFDEAYNKQKPDARFKVIYKSSEEVIRDRPISESWKEDTRIKAIKLLEDEKKDMSEIEYGQEYLGLFMEDLQRFFPEKLLERCLTRNREKIEEGKHYLGCDLARMGGDEITWEIITDIGPKFIHQENIVKVRMLTNEVVEEIEQVASIWNARKVGIDAGAGTIGVSILDYLRLGKIKHKVIPLNNREIVINEEGEDEETQRTTKEDMYFLLRGMMERGEIELLNEEDVWESFRSVQCHYKEADEKGKSMLRIFGRKTHIVEGIVRANYLAKKEKSLNLWAA